MEKNFRTMEDVLADESFLAWYFHKSEEKAESWEKWLATHPEHQLLVDEAVKFMAQVQLEEKELSETRIEAASERLKAAIAMQRDAPPVVSMKRPSSRWWIPVAAAVLVVFAGIIMWKLPGAQKKTYSTAYGQLDKHILPDSSEVILNANSTIKLGSNWNPDGDREVWLDGEAFFKVQKTHMNNKFIVHADAMDIIVTGTQFNVVNRDDESSVLLTEGSVIVKEHNGREVYMKPGDFVRVEDNIAAKKLVNEDRVLSWKEAKLVFENTSINEVAKIIARHYGIKVTLTEPIIGEKKISGVMPNNNLDVLIEALETTGEFKITKNNNEIIISSP